MIKGAIQNANLINGEEVKIELKSDCLVEAIGATKLTVKQGKRHNTNRYLKAKQIEGDVIEVEYTTADKICGQVITIGKHCVIDSVEYSKNISVD